MNWNMWRWAVVILAVALAGCQSAVPLGPDTSDYGATPASRAESQPDESGAAGGEEQTRGMPATETETGSVQTLLVKPNPRAQNLRIYLADEQHHGDWVRVPLKPSGLLYVRPQEVIDRDDLMGVQSATDQQGSGVLIVVLSEQGLQKIHEATAAHPGLRLALVVGHTMLAAPAYTAPITQQKVAFHVGSTENAQRAARAVAGVASDSEPLSAPGSGGSSEDDATSGGTARDAVQ